MLHHSANDILIGYLFCIYILLSILSTIVIIVYGLYQGIKYIRKRKARRGTE